MKFLEILLAFLATQGKSFFQTNTEALSHQIVNNARRVATLLAIATISIALFCAGFSMAYSAAVLNFDRGDGWIWTAHLVGGCLLTIAATWGLIYSLGEKRWMAATGIHTSGAAAAAKPAGPTIENAIAGLIIELTTEFKEKRQNAPKTSGDTSQV